MTAIVQLASSGELGGAERIVLDLLAETRVVRPQWDLHLIVPQEGPLAVRARTLGVEVTVVPWSGVVARLGDAMTGTSDLPRLVLRTIGAFPGIIRDALRLRQALRRIRPSVVHAHGFKMQLLASWARPWRTPLVVHLHDYVGSRRLMSLALRIPRPGSAVMVAISNDVRADARAVLGKRMRIEVVHNGIDLTEWGPDGPRLDLDEAAGLDPAPPGTVRVGLVATMARWKGHETFLRALALLPPGLSVRGYIIGDSIYRTDASQHSVPDLQALASKLGIAHLIGFTGFVEEPAAAMRSLDVVVHASIRPEPFGRVIIEGMAARRAVVARAVGGAAELFVSGVEAIATTTGDPAELAGALERLIADRSFREALGGRGRARVQRDFSRQRMTAEVVRLYGEMLGAS